MPAQANATVTRIAGAGVADDWDAPAAAGGNKWVGEVRGYYRESLDRVPSGGGVSVLKRRELILDYADVKAMGLDTDDVITFRVDGDAADSTGTAQTIPRRELGGVPRGLQTSRIVLADA